MAVAAPVPCRGSEAPRRAGARRIAFDFDFSSAQTLEDDRALADALATAGPDRVALAVHRQWVRNQIFDTAPLPSFDLSASRTSINVQPDPEGRVRTIQTVSAFADRTVPTMSAWLAGAPATVAREVLIDFSIDPATIPQLSYIDVLHDRFDPATVAGKSVLIGPVAIELGDWRSVPRYRALPGPLVQALAFETIAQGRALYPVQGWPAALGAALLILATGPPSAACLGGARSCCSAARCWRSPDRRPVSSCSARWPWTPAPV